MRASRLVAALGAALFAAPASAAPPWWYEPTPRTDAERELAATAAAARDESPEAAAARLSAFAAARPGTPEAGLARLGAGLRLVEAQASLTLVETQLAHPEVLASPVAEWSLRGLALARADADRHAEAAAAWQQALERRPDAPFACEALRSAAASLGEADHPAGAAEILRRSLDRCSSDRPSALLALAQIEEAAGRLDEAAALYDRLDREHPASPEAVRAESRWSELVSRLPPVPPDQRAERELRKALARHAAGLDADAARRLAALESVDSLAGSRDLIRIRLAESEMARRRWSEARRALDAIPATSPRRPEADFLAARVEAERGPAVPAYEAVAATHAGTRWAQEALFALGNHFQRDALDERALPFYRRLYEEYPDGPFLERVTWRVGWGAYRAGDFEGAARIFEGTARQRSASSTAGIFLYWAARARTELGQTEAAGRLLAETVRRFKHTYHGTKAAADLARLPDPPELVPQPPVEPVGVQLPAALVDRLRALVLVERFPEAAEELRSTPRDRGGDATLAWLESRAGRHGAALRAIARAYPQHVGVAGDTLPPEVWRLLYPMAFEERLRAVAAAEGVEPALMAALIRQESAFEPDAVSPAGARGLMQVMPATGRQLARQLGESWGVADLTRPEPSLRMGGRYLRQMLDRFDGRAERALAAYNAGPHRVVAWDALHPGLNEEEFVESIPFTQTRLYVRNVLANREQYRRLYPSPTPDGP